MLISTSRRAAAVAVTCAALLTGGAATSAAAPAAGTGASATSEVRATGNGTSAKAARWAQCIANVNSPHWSKKGKSVIFKTRVACKGNIPAVHVKVRGKLYKKSGSHWKTVAASNETKVKATSGKVSTYYTPKPSGTKVKYDGTYKGKITVQITSPVRGTVDSASSKTVKVNTPGR